MYPNSTTYEECKPAVAKKYTNVTPQLCIGTMQQGMTLSSVLVKNKCDAYTALESLCDSTKKFGPQSLFPYPSEKPKVEYLRDD